MSNTVTVVISTRKKDEKHLKKIQKSFSHPKTEFLVYENDNQYSLSELYNKGLNESSNDIVVFMHDDVFIDTKNVTDKIFKLFKNNPNYGIIGVAGTTDLVSGVWWELRQSLHGQVYHQRDGKKWLSSYDKYKRIAWNDFIPDEKYFNELKRVANNHIIFGFQHYMKYLWPELKGIIIHDFKDNSFNMSHADIAITNLQKRITVFRYLWAGFKKDFKNDLDKNRIHPCEKPNNLYRWILQNYAKPGELIFDSHSGRVSG